MPLKSEVGHRVWKDDSKGSRVTSLTVLRLLNHWTDGLVQYKPSIALPKQGVPDICTENCTHRSVLSYPDTHNFGNSEANLLFKQREKCKFFFLLLSWQPGCPQQRWFQVEESCSEFAWQWAQYVTGWEDIAKHLPPSTPATQENAWSDHTQSPSLQSALEPVCSTVH